MPTPFDIALRELDALERGFVLGTLLLGKAGDKKAGETGGAGEGDDVNEAALTAPLLSPSRERCAEALAALRALPRAARLRATGAMAREAMVSLPAGIENVAIDHLEDALAGESAQTLRLVARDAPASVGVAAGRLLAALDDTRVVEVSADTTMAAELQRAALAAIVAVPGHGATSTPSGGPEPTRSGLRLAALPAGALAVEVATAGARALGARLAAEEADGLGAADLVMALGQRLPRSLAAELVNAATAASGPSATMRRASD